MLNILVFYLELIAYSPSEKADVSAHHTGVNISRFPALPSTFHWSSLLILPISVLPKPVYVPERYLVTNFKEISQNTFLVWLLLQRLSELVCVCVCMGFVWYVICNVVTGI